MSPVVAGLARRARETVPRLPRLATAGGLVVLTLLAGGWLERVAGPGDGATRPFVRTGQVGEAVDARMADVTVLGMRGGSLIKSYGKALDTAGVWVFLRIRVTPRTESAAIEWARLTDGKGRRFDLTMRIDQKMTFATSQPGLPVEGELVFEVPRNLVGPLSVQLACPRIDQRMDAVAQIELPALSPGTVAGWVADKTVLELAVPTS